MSSRGVVDDLLGYLFDRKPHALRPPLAEWMVSSRRFAQFVTTYRDKIRKKLRGAREAEAMRDVQAELEAAYCLLQEARFEVEYEKYGVGRARCPDFTVTFKANVLFNIEVTRIRIPGRAQGELEREASRLADLVGGKLGQMQLGMLNLLWVVVDGVGVEALDVKGAMKRLSARAESRDASLFARHQFSDASDFFRHYRRLSGMIVWEAGRRDAGRSPALWVNNQARPPLPSALRIALENLA